MIFDRETCPENWGLIIGNDQKTAFPLLESSFFL
jgi:hypothetical protein